MKSSQFVFIALATTLALGTTAYARGPMNATGAGMQARAANTSAGTATATQTRAQVHTPGTGLADPSLRVGPGGPTGVPRGIHTPGTGLVTPPVTP